MRPRLLGTKVTKNTGLLALTMLGVLICRALFRPVAGHKPGNFPIRAVLTGTAKLCVVLFSRVRCMRCLHWLLHPKQVPSQARHACLDGNLHVVLPWVFLKKKL